MLDLIQVVLARRATCCMFTLWMVEVSERQLSKQFVGLLAQARQIPTEIHNACVFIFSQKNRRTDHILGNRQVCPHAEPQDREVGLTLMVDVFMVGSRIQPVKDHKMSGTIVRNFTYPLEEYSPYPWVTPTSSIRGSSVDNVLFT